MLQNDEEDFKKVTQALSETVRQTDVFKKF